MKPSESSLWVILDDNNNVVPAKDMHDWLKWQTKNQHRRQLAHTKFEGGRTSTIFLGTDVEWGASLYFETMTFYDSPHLKMDQWRYATWEAAMRHHDKAVGEALRRLKGNP